MLTLTRADKNPIILPGKDDWEKKAAFNGSVVEHDGIYHMVYRALSVTTYYQGNSMNLSTVGYAQSTDGVNFTDHRQFIKPEHDWEIFGCEDPRVTFFEGKFYIFYTALSNYPFSAPGIKVGVAITRDFKTIDEKHLVTPFNAKAMGLFPERINGKIAVILAANTDLPPSKIGIALFDREEEMWDPEYWQNWYAYVDDHALSLQRGEKDQVEVGAVPLKTKDGWLLVYSYIKDYLTDNKIFGIEAALLHGNDPKEILSRTTGPLLTPETDYEKYGDVPNIVFPSGALIHDDMLYVYYGGADTNVCLATCKVDELLSSLMPETHPKDDIHELTEVQLTRFEENPILTPIADHPWEKKAVFNPAALVEEDKIHIVYRAMSDDNTSVFGYAATKDGFHIDERLDDPIYVPREMFERNSKVAGNAGCEDPRITKIDGRYYMLYTAYDGEHPPRVAITSISLEDFLHKEWRWAIPKLISPPDIDDKDACIFPKKINDKYVFLHRLQSGIWIDYVDDLHFYEGNYLGGKILFQPREKKWDSVRIGIAGPPIETEKGWLLLYHGITGEHHYLLGAALLKLDNPAEVISRLDYPIFTPDMKYEQEGQIPNVVFPCGAVVKNGDLFVYYGGADSVVGVATVSLGKLLTALQK